MSYITSIGTANPEHRFNQETIANFMVKAMNLSTSDARKLHVLFRATGIETRHSVLSDFGRENNFEFFSDDNFKTAFPSTHQRMALFKKHALDLSLEAIRDCFNKRPSVNKSEITHLIFVSCTGLYAPGLDIELVKALGLNTTVHRTCINFMGCYAAFNAIKMADTICQHDENSKVLIVCTELCSIHFQKETTEDNLLANALFADGCAALFVEAKPCKGINLKPQSFHCDLAFEGEQVMAWTVGDFGFEMKLSTYVPEVIGSGIKTLTQSLLSQLNKKLSDVDYFAIHPGGKKILEIIEEELKLTKDQNRYAYNVLQKYGNMSSPTVVFVLNEIAKELKDSNHDKTILSFAFGPGLTLESMLIAVELH